ncbi:glycosyltransferase [Chitinimonas sp. BJYL2]|uniref:glycosyltransferase n=1 Tax=Chitinimonas sp. BJYL2 TaxID=2976696 RepID=UPI0022B2E3B0|nr:glycosyltransferase [Chitinimonas sp. BJYL2]
MPEIHLFARRADIESVLITLRDCLENSVHGLPVWIHAQGSLALALADALVPGRVQMAPADLWPNGDVILLAAGVRLPYGWDARLVGAAKLARGYATLSPLCRELPYHAPVAASVLEVSLDDADRIVLDGSLGEVWATPICSNACVLLFAKWVDPDSLQRWADAEQTEPFSLWLTEQNASHGLTDVVLVGAPDDFPRIALPEALSSWVAACGAINPLHYRQYRTHCFPPYLLDRRPVQLHVMHSWGGGLERWVQDYCKADTGRVNLVLKSIGNVGLYGQRVALYLGPEASEPVRVWQFDCAIRGTADHHPEYRRMLEDVISEFQVDAVIVSSLIGHALDAFRTGLPTVHVWHEYYPFCPALYIHRAGHTCSKCDPVALRTCRQENPLYHLFPTVLDEEWLALREQYAEAVLNNVVRLVAPTESVVRNYAALAPRLTKAEPVVIEHGVSWLEPGSWQPTVSTGRLTVVVLGRLSVAKGQALLDAALPEITGFADVVLLGCGDAGERYRHFKGLSVVPHYDALSLPTLLREYAPDIGLLLSIVPETFSYTLSELMCAGIPPLATNHGAYLSRIQDGVNGYLCPPDAGLIVRRLKSLDADRNSLKRTRDVLVADGHRTTQDMVADYHALLPLRAMAAGYSPRRRGLEPCEPGTLVGQMAGFPKPFRQALYDAHGYLRVKLSQSAKLRPWQRRGLQYLLELGMRAIYKLWGIAGRLS